MPTYLSGAQSISRRSTGSARHRENRISQNAQTPTTRRRMSRSPISRVALEPIAIARNDSSSRKKKRPGLISAFTAPGEHPIYTENAEEVGLERGRELKVKHRTQSNYLEEDDASRGVARSSAGSSRGKRKQRSRSKSKELPPLPGKMASPDATDSEADRSTHGGPDLLRMKSELESLRKQISVSKKAVHKQSKVIDDLRKDLATSTKKHKDQSAELETLRNQTKKVDDLVGSFETNLTCQICMDLLSRPHGLSPCGHILCQGCLQEWFRSAPPADDEMYDDDYPETLLFRKKTCPCCRTVVRSRPIPLFLVKSLVSALEKAKTLPNAPRRASPPLEDGDPWAGIFASPHVHGMDDPWSDDGDEDDEDEDEDYDDDDDWSFDGYGTADDEERYEGAYVHSRWAPPSVHVTAADYPYIDELDAEDIAMLRRGATLQMIDLFSMHYSHEEGLQAIVDDANTVFLGWNIYLHPNDTSGEEFMDWIMKDMYDRPERWDIEEDRFGAYTARKLVPEDDVEDFDTTDSEAWAEELADEDI